MPFTYDHPHPAVTVDACIFRKRAGRLQVLLVQRARSPYAGSWALPGGFVAIDEELEEAARRELEEETGLTDVSLEQCGTFGRVDRDPRERVISVAYVGLLQDDDHRPEAGSDARDVAWFPVDEIPELAFDHAVIVKAAANRIPAGEA